MKQCIRISLNITEAQAGTEDASKPIKKAGIFVPAFLLEKIIWYVAASIPLPVCGSFLPVHEGMQSYLYPR